MVTTMCHLDTVPSLRYDWAVQQVPLPSAAATLLLASHGWGSNRWFRTAYDVHEMDKPLPRVKGAVLASGHWHLKPRIGLWYFLASFRQKHAPRPGKS